MEKKTGNFCNRCPRRLSKTPSEPCPLGLEYATAQTDGTRRRHSDDRGCSWGILSAEHNYCFWTYLRSNSDEDGRMEPVPDKEICALLGISQSTLENVLSSALNKLRSLKDSEALQEFKEAVAERSSNDYNDNTVYLPDNFRVPTPTEDEEKEEIPEDLMPAEKKRRPRTLPLHRDGKKVDIYGITSRKKLVRMRTNEKD